MRTLINLVLIPAVATAVGGLAGARIGGPFAMLGVFFGLVFGLYVGGLRGPDGRDERVAELERQVRERDRRVAELERRVRELEDE